MVVREFLSMSLVSAAVVYLASSSPRVLAFTSMLKPTRRVIISLELSSSKYYSNSPKSQARLRKIHRNSPIFSSWQEQMYSSLFGKPDTEEEIDPGKIEGTELRILKYPHPSLRAHNKVITLEEIESGEISKLAKEMFLVMYGTNGCGLAAPQVGINKRLLVYNVSGDPKRWLDEVVMINPKIIESSEGKDIENEGCLSFPNLRGDVERSKWIKVEFMNVKGKSMKKKFVGWDARVFQHEYDHLEGVVFTDRMTDNSKGAVKEKLDQMVTDFGVGGAI